RLKPNDPLVYRAFGAYYGSISPVDAHRAVDEYAQGVRLFPDNTALLASLGNNELTIGRWDSAATRLARASLLDPRSVTVAVNLADVYLRLGQFAAADSAADRALALAPTNQLAQWQKVLVALARGHLDTARAVIRAAARQIDPSALFAYFATY